jgi:hypothetical protein
LLESVEWSGVEFGVVAVWVENIERTRTNEAEFKNENYRDRDHDVGQHEVYAIHMAISRLALEIRQAGIGVAGDSKGLHNHQSQPPSCLNEPQHGSTRKRHLHVAKRAWAVGACQGQVKRPIKIAVAGEIACLHNQ